MIIKEKWEQQLRIIGQIIKLEKPLISFILQNCMPFPYFGGQCVHAKSQHCQHVDSPYNMQIL